MAAASAQFLHTSFTYVVVQLRDCPRLLHLVPRSALCYTPSTTPRLMGIEGGKRIELNRAVGVVLTSLFLCTVFIPLLCSPPSLIKCPTPIITPSVRFVRRASRPFFIASHIFAHGTRLCHAAALWLDAPATCNARAWKSAVSSKPAPADDASQPLYISISISTTVTFRALSPRHLHHLRAPCATLQCVCVARER